MKLAFFFVVVAVAFVSASPVPDAPVLKIVKSDFDIKPEGGYNFGFETENKIVRSESGELKVVKDEEGKDAKVLVMRGTFSYPDPEGNLITLNFVADETGFHPEGAHIPVAPVARK